MSFLTSRRPGSRLYPIMVQVMGACIVAYFTWHAIEGERGLVALGRVEKQIAVAQASLDQVKSEHDKMDQRATLLRPNHLDPDMLDERARAMLNWSNPNDIVILKHQDDEQGGAKR